MTQLIEGTIPETGEVVKVIVEKQGGPLQPIAALEDIPRVVQEMKDAIHAVVQPGHIGYIDGGGIMHNTQENPAWKPYWKSEAWQALAYYFGISLECSMPVRQTCENGTTYYMYLSTCRAIGPNGRFVQVTGSCSSKDKFFTKAGKKDATEPYVASKAQTNAMNRAVARLLGLTEYLPDADTDGDGGRKESGSRKPGAEASGETAAQAKINAVKQLKEIMTVPNPFSPSELAKTIAALDTSKDIAAVIARAQAERDKRMQKGAA